MDSLVDTAAAPYQLTPLELARGIVSGIDPDTPPLPEAPPGLSARAALENVVLAGLLRPPCVVSFSGGRDSSAVLALATRVARREGLALPVPVTLRLPRYPDADEDAWQELVVRHLSLPHWIRLSFDHELDTVGPYAQAMLNRHGLRWPSNVHSHLPIAERAPGGTVLTGFGGDELLYPGWVWHRVNQVLAGRIRPTRRDLARIAAAYSPAPLRRVVLRRRLQLLRPVPPAPWLRPDVQRRVAEVLLDELVAEPARWDRAVDLAWWRLRYRRVAEDTLARVGGMHGAVMRHPLTDGVVLAAIIREAGRAGFGDRTAAMAHLVGDLLPADLITRPTKAAFTGAFWNRHTAAFAAGWDGTGVDPDLVDIDVLRGMWTSKERPPDVRTSSLLQLAWLAGRPATVG